MAKLDLVHRLADGRRLGYCEYGDYDGLAIVALHGTPGSRYKFGLADQEARRLGLRLISPDRWGYGLSDAPTGTPGLAAYAADIAELARALELPRFGVVGISGGGPYAVALAAQMVERVDALALVAPVAPVSEAEERDGVSLFHRFAFRGLPRVPGAVSLAFLYFRGVLSVSPSWAARTMAARAGPPDRILLAQVEVRDDLAQTFRAGLASGVRGPEMDMGYFSRDWQLDFDAINMPARMWLGGQDRNIPVPAARMLANRLETLDLIEVADAGHFWVTKHYPQVLEWLRATLSQRSDARPSSAS